MSVVDVGVVGERAQVSERGDLSGDVAHAPGEGESQESHPLNRGHPGA